MKKRICPKCGERWPVSTYTCPNCNASLAAATVEEVDDSVKILKRAPESKVCPKCGERVGSNSRTCSNCGAFIASGTTYPAKSADEIGPVSLKDRKLVKTIIVNNESRKSASSSILRGAVGGALFGVAGAVGGAMSGKTKGETTFLVIYNDGSREVETVKTNGVLYRLYLQYLDVE